MHCSGVFRVSERGAISLPSRAFLSHLLPSGLAGPWPDRTCLGSFFDWRRSVCGVFHVAICRDVNFRDGGTRRCLDTRRFYQHTRPLPPQCRRPVTKSSAWTCGQDNFKGHCASVFVVFSLFIRYVIGQLHSVIGQILYVQSCICSCICICTLLKLHIHCTFGRMLCLWSNLQHIWASAAHLTKCGARRLLDTSQLIIRFIMICVNIFLQHVMLIFGIACLIQLLMLAL